jgi:O-antigen ligase
VLHYHPVVDQIIQAYPLDPLAAIAFVATFAVAAFATARRPAYGLALLIVLVPFALYRDVLGTTITLPKIAILGVLIGLTTFSGIFARLREQPALRFLLVAAAVLIAMIISIAQAGDVHAALRESLKAVEYPLFFIAAFLCFRLDPDTRIITWAIAGISAVVAVMALSQEVLGAPSGMYFNNEIIPRLAGPLEGPNQLAAYFEVSIALLASCLCVAKSRSAAVALTLVAFADVLTFSRAGLIGAMIAVVVIAVIYRRSAVALIVPLASGGVLGLVAAGLWAAAVHTTQVFGARAASSGHLFSGTAYAGGVGSRSQLWHAAFVLLKRRWLLGVGAGNFELDLPQAGLFGIRTHANSLYIQAWVEGGLPLLAATLALVYTSIATFLTRARSGPFIAGALAASVALALHQIVDYVIFYPKVGEWWWIALALGAAQLASSVPSKQQA